MSETEQTVAAIDCGTNAVRLLVADIDAEGRMRERTRLMRIVRLGEGVDRTGEFSDAALTRTFAALDEYREVLSAEGVVRTRFVATSASRDVSNRGAFAAGVHDRVGVAPEVISGQEEAALSFTGALRGLPESLVTLPALVVDIGGGSTEFVLGSAAPEWAISVDIGCVRLTERHLAGDPPTAGEVARTAADIERALALVLEAVPVAQGRCLIGLAGTVTTVAAMALGLDRYDASVLHGSVVSAGDVDSVTETLLAMPRYERAALPFMHPGRVDVIAAGAMILRASLTAGGFGSVLVSETDILDGIVYSMKPS